MAGATLINQPRRKQMKKSYKRNPSHPTPYRKLLRPRSLKFSSRTFQLPKRKKQRYDIPPSQTCFVPETLGVEGVREKPISSRNKQPEEKKYSNTKFNNYLAFKLQSNRFTNKLITSDYTIYRILYGSEKRGTNNS